MNLLTIIKSFFLFSSMIPLESFLQGFYSHYLKRNKFTPKLIGLLSDLKKSEMNDQIILQKLLEKVENKNPSEYLISDEPILFNIALLMNQKLDYKKALSYLEIASSLNPNREATWFSMAQIYDIFGDYNKSISCYEKTILLAKNIDVISASYSNAINLLLKENRLSEAAKMSDDAINYDPESDINWINAGNVMRATGNYLWSISCFEKALNLTRDSPIISLNNLGFLYSRVNNREKAIIAYRTALEYDEYEENSLYNLAILEKESGNSKVATELLEKCLKVNPGNDQALFLLGALTGDESIKSSPQSYISDLFDFYAEIGYENHLIKELKYKGHEEIFKALINTSAVDEWNTRGKNYNILDLGCGSGLVGKMLRREGFIGYLAGCDLSSSMVKLASDLKYSEQDRGSKIDSSNEVARKNMDESDGSTSASTSASASASAVCDEIERSPRWLASARRTFPENYHEPPPSPSPSKFDASSGDLSVYDRTDVLDCQSTIENFIVSDPHIKFNLILAADVICYLGDLLPLFRSIVSILSGSVGSSDGKFAFTIEKSLNSDRDYILGKDTIRFAHSMGYIKKLVDDFQMQILYRKDVILRSNGGYDVLGTCYVVTKI